MLFISVLLSIYVHILSGVLTIIRFWLRVYVPEYDDRLVIYESTALVVLYTTMGNSINNFTITFTLVIVSYCVMLTVMGRFIITLFIAETCAIMESVNKNKNVYKVFASKILSFISTKDVSEPLQKEMECYLQLMWVHHQGVDFPHLLEKVPYYLKEATLNAMFGCHIRKHSVLGNCHVDLIRQMATEMRLTILFPGNIVVNKGDINQCMYFIHQGIVDALSEDSIDCEVIEHTLVAGDSFGLIQGIHPRHGHDYTYKVRKHTILVKLERHNWFHILSMFPASQEIISDYLNTQHIYDQNN
ncbi:cyclic nucleotide-gated cation channel subunit a [Holotrichia oblita]|nr:cyclic nucleotide-gated cation channel subunit a [Holotrichia oblita]